MSRSRRSTATASSFGCSAEKNQTIPMSSVERLQHIRNALTRLKYITEKAHHTVHLDETDKATSFFSKLKARISSLEYNPKKKGTKETGPKYLSWLLKEVTNFITHGKGEVGENIESIYPGLSQNLIKEATIELEEIKHLIESKGLSSRIDMNLLKDQVSFHINDFDYLLSHRVHQFIAENVREGVAYSHAIQDISDNKPPIGLVSLQLLDVVVGVHPSNVATAILEHLNAKIKILLHRVEEASAVLEHHVTDPDEQIIRSRQKHEYSIMEARIRDAQQTSERLEKDWKDQEASLFEKAFVRNVNLESLAQLKKVKEMQIAEDAAQVHDDISYRCLPFVSPQYHRRYQLTYSNPCQIRIGLRFFDKENKKFLTVPNTCPEYFSMCAKNPDHDPLGVIDYLIPSQHKMWIPFDDFPEMVMGRRCSLHGIEAKDDLERAMEEHKEVGSYFLMKGGERILRPLLMQRCNIPINIFRQRFVTQGPHFSPRAVVMRCKRSSGLTSLNYFYYSTIGEVLFSFSRKVVWHIPASLLMFCMKPGLTPVNLFQQLTVGMGTSANHAPRVEALLQHHQTKAYGDLDHFIDYIAVIGRMFVQYHQNSNTFHFISDLHPTVRCHHDAWYGLFMIRRHILPHLNCDVPTPNLSEGTTDFTNWPGEAIVEELERKFSTMCSIIRQLYSFVDEKGHHQGNDVPAYQEVFTSSQVLIGAFEVSLNGRLRGFVYRLGSMLNPTTYRNLFKLGGNDRELAKNTCNELREYFKNCATRNGTNALAPMSRLLTTGNFSVDREEDFFCPQFSGWVVMAEHLNFFRFFEQLKCLHRGKTVAEMRSSEVRKYPCEAYGFICMVHSPDGEDCGILNHMSISTIVTSSMHENDWNKLWLWMNDAAPNMMSANCPISDRTEGVVPLWMEGCVIGYLKAGDAEKAAIYLREKKSITDSSMVTRAGLVLRKNVSPLNTIEVVYVPPGGKEFPGLFIFAENGRLMRPVAKVLASKSSDEKMPFPLTFVGTWEQTWLDIAGVPSDLDDASRQLGKTYDYMEQNGTNIISFTSATIPFFEHNCSPRNLFQCGLSKQTAGTQLQALGWRKEAKLFRMYTPQRYIVRTLANDFFGIDDVSLGVNATIAILSYTGYDMDDAVIINNTAKQRGFLNAGVTIAKVISSSKETSSNEEEGITVFNNHLAGGARYTLELDDNGLPPKRTIPSNVSFERDHSYPALLDNTPVYCTAKRFKRVNPDTGNTMYEYTRHHITRWKHFDKGEAAWVHSVIPLKFDGPDVTSALVVFRIPRPPHVGDKFSSRHGQKGTLPLHINAIDLPFSSECGFTPDVLINPHAFPSRMTVGMILEIIAAKLGAIEGRFIDGSAWTVVDDKPRAAQDIGDALVRNGFHKYGRERLICGVSGVEMEAEVFTGITGYQRLRHMVNDKWQSRSKTDAHTHRAVTKTGQPVKGRKRHGGVRIGEMERDGLLSHGISEVVLDRMLHVSDKTKAFICSECGGLMSIYERHTTKFSSWKSCKFCSAGINEATDTIMMIDIPQVFRLWVTELASIGVRVTLNVK